jgi:hypothetical protein
MSATRLGTERRDEEQPEEGRREEREHEHEPRGEPAPEPTGLEELDGWVQRHREERGDQHPGDGAAREVEEAQSQDDEHRDTEDGEDGARPYQDDALGCALRRRDGGSIADAPDESCRPRLTERSRSRH